MRFNDAVIGIFLIVSAVVVYLYARTLPDSPGQQYGAAVFPVIISWGLAGCGLSLTVYGLRNWEGATFLADWTNSPTAWFRGIGSLALVLVYIVLSEPLGFLLTSTLVMFAMLMLLDTKWWVALVVAVAVSLLIERSFGSLLLVPLPHGLLWI
jgi:putative tricarboxylic transport membrane protein